MAVGGVLRAALKAGNWARAAAESRRASRALRNLNRSGFGQMVPDPSVNSFYREPSDASTYLRSRGVDVDAMTAPGSGNPYLDWTADYDGPRGYFADSPFGGIVQYQIGGGRFRPAQAQYSPIVAPYEGVRTWPMFKSEFGDKFPAADYISPWVGRGPAPKAYAGNPYDDGFAGSMPAFMPYSLAYGYRKGVFDSSVPTAFHGPFLRPWDY